MDSREQCTVVFKTKVHKKSSITGSHKQYTRDSNIDPKEMIGILGLRSLGYYKNKTGCTAAKFEQVLSFCISI